jgi:hypothetical protein
MRPGLGEGSIVASYQILARRRCPECLVQGAALRLKGRRSGSVGVRVPISLMPPP